MSRKESFTSAVPKLNCDVLKFVKRFSGSGGKAGDGICRIEYRDTFEADRQNRRLKLQIAAQGTQRSLLVQCAAGGLQKLVAARIAPAAVIQAASGSQQRREVPICWRTSP